MNPEAAAAIIWWWVGIIPAGVVAYRRRGADGWSHVFSRALYWPLFLALSGLGLPVWDGAPAVDSE